MGTCAGKVTTLAVIDNIGAPTSNVPELAPLTIYD